MVKWLNEPVMEHPVFLKIKQYKFESSLIAQYVK